MYKLKIPANYEQNWTIFRGRPLVLKFSMARNAELLKKLAITPELKHGIALEPQ